MTFGFLKESPKWDLKKLWKKTNGWTYRSLSHYSLFTFFINKNLNTGTTSTCSSSSRSRSLWNLKELNQVYGWITHCEDIKVSTLEQGRGGNLVWSPLGRDCIIFFVSLCPRSKAVPRIHVWLWHVWMVMRANISRIWILINVNVNWSQNTIPIKPGQHKISCTSLLTGHQHNSMSAGKTKYVHIFTIIHWREEDW